MEVSTLEIRRVFNDLLNERRTREEVASWASALRRAEDTGSLRYVPSNAEAEIWKALEFLMGIDLKESPNTYLHELGQVRAYWEEHSKAFGV